MKKVSNKIKILLSVCAVVLVAAIVAVVLLPGFSQKQVQNYSYVAEKQSGADSSAYDIVIGEKNNANFVIDSKTANVFLKSSDGRILFNSRSEDAARHSLASVLNVRLRDIDGNSYTMNSTDNSVGFKTFEVKSENDNKAQLVFRLFPDAKQAEKGIG